MRIFLTSHSYNISSWFIRKFTKSKVSHTGIEDPDRKLVLHATSTGLHFSHLRKFLRSNEMVYSYVFLPSTTDFEKTKTCFLRMLELLEEPYDHMAIIGFIIRAIFGNVPKVFGKKNALFCSEALFIFIGYCIDDDVIGKNILEGYDREQFSPEDAHKLMGKYPEYFKLCKK